MERHAPNPHTRRVPCTRFSRTPAPSFHTFISLTPSLGTHIHHTQPPPDGRVSSEIASQIDVTSQTSRHTPLSLLPSKTCQTILSSLRPTKKKKRSDREMASPHFDLPFPLSQIDIYILTNTRLLSRSRSRDFQISSIIFACATSLLLVGIHGIAFPSHPNLNFFFLPSITHRVTLDKVIRHEGTTSPSAPSPSALCSNQHLNSQFAPAIPRGLPRWNTLLNSTVTVCIVGASRLSATRRTYVRTILPI